MNQRRDLSEPVAIVLVAMAFAVVAALGHVAFPAMDTIWLVIGFFAVAAVVQALWIQFLSSRSSGR